jgi:hypothetical protein
LSTLDADKDRVCKNDILNLTKDKTEEERYQAISMLAVATHAPVIVVCCYLGELYGFWPELKALLKRLMEFYKVDEVTNVKGDYK